MAEEVKLELLTDEDIVDYSRSDGKDRIIKSHKDFNLNYKKLDKLYTPETDGLYDGDIFGSPFENRCICGKIKHFTKEPCPNCGCRVYSKEEALRRFARVELPFYYLASSRYEVFRELFNAIFVDTDVKLVLIGDDSKGTLAKKKNTRKLDMRYFDLCQFTYSKANNRLTISEFVTDEKKCSYEGLKAIIEKHFPSYLRDYMKLINRYFLILPAAMRRVSFKKVSGKNKKAILPRITIWYQIIVRFCCREDEEANSNNFDKVMARLNTPGEKARYVALLRALINSGKRITTDLLNTSKENLARDLYSARVKNSARCPIIPSTTLAVDEIGVPIHVAYEMCREGFIRYLMKELNFTWDEAKKSTKLEYNDPTLLEHFKKYAESQVVLNYLLVQ